MWELLPDVPDIPSLLAKSGVSCTSELGFTGFLDSSAADFISGPKNLGNRKTREL